MHLHFHAHNCPPGELSPLTRAAVDGLIAVCREMPYLFWPEKSEKVQSELTERKRKELRRYESLQSLYNVWLRQALEERGFESECPVRDARTAQDDQRVDFAAQVEEGRRLLVEVEFGYVASQERNLFKLMDAYNWGRSVMGVQVCPVARLAALTASGVASFEATRKLLMTQHPATTPCPILLIGLDYERTERIDMSQSQLPSAQCLSGNAEKTVLWHVAKELRAGTPVEDIGLPDASSTRSAMARLRQRVKIPDGQAQLFV